MHLLVAGGEVGGDGCHGHVDDVVQMGRQRRQKVVESFKSMDFDFEVTVLQARNQVVENL